MAAGLNTGTQRAAALAAALLLGACGADQAAGDGPREPFRADVYVHNDGHADAELRLSRLDPAAELDCEAFAERPWTLFDEPIFAPPEALWLPVAAAAPARDMDEDRPCHAVLVEEEARPAIVIFWRNGQVPETWVEGQIDDPGEHRPGAVLLVPPGPESPGYTSPGAELVYTAAGASW